MADVTELTTKVIDGDGVFDKFMCAVEVHLKKEYDAGRIKANEYSTVYLGALQSAMGQSIQYIATQATVGLTNAQAELARKNLTKTDKEIEILEQQRLNAIEEVANSQKQRELITKQIEKLTSEIDLLAKKCATELAQTDGTGVNATSVIGRQMTLYGNQADGYLRDAEQKAVKYILDTWAVRRTTDNGTTADTTNHLDDETIGNAVTILLQGIGVNVAPPQPPSESPEEEEPGAGGDPSPGV